MCECVCGGGKGRGGGGGWNKKRIDLIQISLKTEEQIIVTFDKLYVFEGWSEKNVIIICTIKVYEKKKKQSQIIVCFQRTEENRGPA